MENTVKEVVETIVEETPEVITKTVDRFWKGFGAGVATTVGGFVADKFVVRPTIKKIKDKRAAKKAQVECGDSKVVEFSDVDILETEE